MSKKPFTVRDLLTSISRRRLDLEPSRNVMHAANVWRLRQRVCPAETRETCEVAVGSVEHTAIFDGQRG